MGMDKIKWLKHYANDYTSESIMKMIDDGGFAAYGRYWFLLTFLARHFDGENTEFTFPMRTIRETFRFRSWNDCRSFAVRLSNVRGMTAECTENVFKIDAPILLELLHRDFKRARKQREDGAPKKKEERIKNKEKEKVKKENPDGFSDPPPPKTSTHWLKDLWNKHAGSLPKARNSISASRMKKIKARVKDEPSESVWAIAIKRVAESDFCNGRTDRGSWVATFDWLLQADTLDKILEGKYDNRQGKTKNAKEQRMIAQRERIERGEI